jgi:hypothetical protein
VTIRAECSNRAATFFTVSYAPALYSLECVESGFYEIRGLSRGVFRGRSVNRSKSAGTLAAVIAKASNATRTQATRKTKRLRSSGSFDVLDARDEFKFFSWLLFPGPLILPSRRHSTA